MNFIRQDDVQVYVPEMISREFYKLLIFLLIGFFGVFYFFPLVKLFGVGLSYRKQISFFDPIIVSTLKMTLLQIGASTLFSGGIGLFVAFLMWKTVQSKRWLSLLSSSLLFPFCLPPFFLAYVWIHWFGASGFFHQFFEFFFQIEWSFVYRLSAVIGCHVLVNAPFVAVVMLGALFRTDTASAQLLITLGAKKKDRFFLLYWPQVRMSFWVTLAQVASFCSLSFALVTLLGGGPPVQTLETLIFGGVKFGFFQDSEKDLALSSICGVWQLGLGILLWTIAQLGAQSRPERDGKRFEVLFKPRFDSSELKANAFLSFVLRLVLLGGLLAPFFVLFEAETLKEVFRWNLPQEVQQAFFQSVRMSIIASLVSATLALCVLFLLFFGCSHSFLKFGTTVFGSLGGVSSIVLSLGVWLSFGEFLDLLEFHEFVVVMIQGFLFFPFCFRLLLPIFSEFEGKDFWQVRCFGASLFQSFWISFWPRLKEPLRKSLALCAIFSFGEFGAVSFFSSERFLPLAVLISRWNQNYHFKESKLALFVMLLGILAFLGLGFLSVPKRRVRAR